jgi:very-short-patch-repair endonuclease
MPKAKTQEQFEQEVFELVGNEYGVIGKYINNNIKIKIRHNVCGHEYSVRPCNLLVGKRCPKCSGKMLKTTEIFQKEVFELVGHGYVVLGEYVTSKTKIKIKHTECGHEYEVTPNHFLRGIRCPNCFGTKKKTPKQFKKEVFNLVGEKYTILGKYINNFTKIKIRHNENCDYVFEMISSNFLMGQRCPKCFGKFLKTQDEFEKEIYNLVGDEYSILSIYSRATDKIKIRHNKCKHEWDVVAHSFLCGNRCPKCKLSRGEQKISKILEKYNINYIQEYKFSDCKDKRELPFDFYLKDYNCLIEFDGKQHYIPESFDSNKTQKHKNQNFIDLTIKDDIKTNYCKEKNIKLIRIPFWELNNIEKILQTELGI